MALIREHEKDAVYKKKGEVCDLAAGTGWWIRCLFPNAIAAGRSRSAAAVLGQCDTHVMCVCVRLLCALRLKLYYTSVCGACVCVCAFAVCLHLLDNSYVSN